MLDKVKPATAQAAPISIYQPRQTGLIYPEIPVFDNVADERQHRKERLVAACRAWEDRRVVADGWLRRYPDDAAVMVAKLPKKDRPA